MSIDTETMPQTAQCAVTISPATINPGAPMTLRAEVFCRPAQDLRGRSVALSEPSGAEVARLEIVAFDGTANATDALTIPAPKRVGAHRWLATVDIGADAPVETEVAIDVAPYATRVLVWDLPSTVVVGEAFFVTVGVKSAGNRSLAGQSFELRDQAEAVLATGVLTDATRPGSEALHCARIELMAPSTAGLLNWQAAFPAIDGDAPHAEGIARFGINVVERPEARISVQALDRNGRAPVKGAQVVMHPYRAAGDAAGKAEIRAPRGQYTLFVSGPRYVTSRHAVDLSEDLDMVVELMLEPPSTRE